MTSELIKFAAKQTAKHFLSKVSLGFLSGPATYIVACILEYAFEHSIISTEMVIDGLQVNAEVTKYKEVKEKFLKGEDVEQEFLDAFRALSSL